MRRKGSEISQTNGHRISANNASGQHSTSNISQPTKTKIGDTVLPD